MVRTKDIMVLIEVYLGNGEKVSSHLTPSFWDNLLATNLALNLFTLPFTACLILLSHMEVTIGFPFGLGTMSHTSFFMMDMYSMESF